jgi:subtilisin family serine protease
MFCTADKRGADTVKSNGTLVKIVEPSGGMAALAATQTGHQVQPLFQISAPLPPGAAAAAAPTHRWVRVRPVAPGAAAAAATQHPWDLAYQLRRQMQLQGMQVVTAEPDLEQSWLPDPPAGRAAPALALSARSDRPAPDDQAGAPYAKGPQPAWYLDDGFSQLRAARAAIGDGPSHIKIAHLDTGFDPKHKACPIHIVTQEQRNFVDADRQNSAEDDTPSSGLLNFRGHGTGTIGILAGPQVTGVRPTQTGASLEGETLGGAPMMQIVPVRIANSVALLRTGTVAQGIDYAIEIGADVISMSLGGLPSQAWADACNKAYDQGVVVVCAAGNNYGGLPTGLVVYPARFNRVIGACGVMADKTAYLNLPPWAMEGNAGPGSKMATALAAYTPNIPWARLGFPDWIDLNGGGTSAATAQIAAAAALWLHENGGNYPAGNWQRAEAARRALFDSALAGQTSPDPQLGRGLLRAQAALQIAQPANLTRVDPDDASFAFLYLVSSIFGIGAGELVNGYALELTQLALTSRAAQDALPDPDLPPKQIPTEQRRRFLQAILEEGRASLSLRGHIARILGTDASSVALPPTTTEATEVAPAAAAFNASRGSRELLPAPPASRRLRIFATDPGASASLQTAFINIATVEVPWENRRHDDNLLTEGPVGEYLEVVDIDPASGVAYDPVDLNNPFLLAQDGLTPSEGSPQFHQQMVYAVAMRTIRNFETALGRRALWAEREVPIAAHGTVEETRSERAFVRRLRLYPHALREANAYYSPEKRALLFGYFPATADGRHMVFTCLSHDIIAHETTHALLDGLHRFYQEQTNVDVPAFHEAFADIVAIFQHFTFPELLRYTIETAHGDLSQGDMMADLARQFGQAIGQIGQRGALRSAIGTAASPDEYEAAQEPHERGRVLVAAVFDAFVAIYKRRTQDLMRLATGGSGILRPGALHPDLVGRLAKEAAKSAQHVLKLSIRALDYMPPVNLRFGDFLRALITADSDLVPADRLGYRVAFVEAFGARGIVADGVRTLSPESLRWQTLGEAAQPWELNRFIRERIDISWAAARVAVRSDEFLARAGDGARPRPDVTHQGKTGRLQAGPEVAAAFRSALGAPRAAGDRGWRNPHRPDRSHHAAPDGDAFGWRCCHCPRWLHIGARPARGRAADPLLRDDSGIQRHPRQDGGGRRRRGIGGEAESLRRR